MDRNLYIFLDIDGVMATTSEITVDIKEYNKANIRKPYLEAPYKFNKDCVAALNEIIDTVNPTIILTSSWRKYFDLDQMEQIFADNGIKKFPEGSTHVKIPRDIDTEKGRVDEIVAYIRYCGIKNWVVIDNYNLKKYFKEKNHDRIIITDPDSGIAGKLVKETVIKRLNRFYETN